MPPSLWHDNWFTLETRILSWKTFWFIKAPTSASNVSSEYITIHVVHFRYSSIEQFDCFDSRTDIYGLRCIPTQQRYIGQLGNIFNRWNHHVVVANCKHHSNRRLQQAVDKRHWKAFEFTILEECDETELNFRELFWMQQYGSFMPLLGFNTMVEYFRLVSWVQKRSR